VEPETCKECSLRFLFEKCPDDCPVIKEYLAAEGFLFKPAANGDKGK
jgi:hypothetical protein